jgi:hypothetical protein
MATFRLRFRFWLRALLFCLTLFLPWTGYFANRAHRERRAVELLARREASFSDGSVQDESTLPVSALPWGRHTWNRAWCEAHIVGVSLTSDLDEEVVVALRDLPHLRGLTYRAPFTNRRRFTGSCFAFRRSRVPRGVLPRALSSVRLKPLALEHCALEDPHPFATQKRLSHLALVNVSIRGDALADTFQLPRLTHLSLEDSIVVGELPKSAPGSPSLETIVWRSAPLSDEFGRILRQYPRLRALYLDGSSATDRLWTHLRGHPTLAFVSLVNTQITDHSFEVVADLPALKRVNLPDSISFHRAVRLQKDRPEVEIWQVTNGRLLRLIQP